MLPIPMQHAVRRLLADARLTATAVLTLSLGLSSAVLVLDMLDRLLLRPPAHVSDPTSVTRVYIASGPGVGTATDYATFEGLENELVGELEQVATYFSHSLSVGLGASAEQVEVVAHSPAYFDVLGLRPELGSLDTEVAGSPPQALISHRLWQRRFGGSPGVIGQPLRLATELYTIAGVLPRGFAGIDFTAVDVWLPLSARASRWYGPNWQSANIPILEVIARLRPGADREAAAAHATAVYHATHEHAMYQESTLMLGGLTRPPEMSETSQVTLWIGGMSLVVLLIACGNVANLLFVRGMRRAKESSIKVALGASRGRLVGETLMEALLLSAAAGTVALAVVAIGGTTLQRLFMPTVAPLVSSLDLRLVALTAVVCLAATFLLAMLPALRLTSNAVLSPRNGVPRSSRLLNLFAGAQVALAVPLLVGGGLLVLSYTNAANQDFGFDSRRVVVVTTNLVEIGGNSADNSAAHRRMRSELAAMQEVEAAAIVNEEPWRGRLAGVGISVPGRDLPPGRVQPINAVDPEFFDVMRLPLTEGRLFTNAENRKEAFPVAVISDAMARALWPGESPLGKCLLFGSPGNEEPCTEIVGVVGDARWAPSIRPTGARQQIVFVPIEQRDMHSGRAILVRVAGDPHAVLPLLRERIHAAGPDFPYVQVRSFDETFEPLLRPWRLGATVFVAFGLVALTIATVGLIVLTSYAVTRRFHELAVRTACGAQPDELVRYILGRVVAPMLTGLAIGVAGAYVGARMLDALLFDVAPADPRVFVGAIAGLLTCAVFGALFPARRAGRVDPVVALRAE